MPWNFPFWQVFSFAVPAMCAGNVCVLKHTSNVPGSALEIEKVFLEAGFPENVFSTLLIGSKTAMQILNEEMVDGVSLTGSVGMGKRGSKPQFTDIACPNDSCKFYGLKGKGNVVGNGTSISRGETVRKYICRHCGKVFNDHTGAFYYDLRKEERVIDLALKSPFGGMSEEGIA